MNRCARLLVCSALALVSSLAILPTGRAASAVPASPARALVIHQSHGSATRPARPTGYTLTVRGVPGAEYEIWITPTGGTAALFSYGTLPAGGALTTALHVPGSTPNPHTESVEVTSRSTARIAALLLYD